MRCGGLVLWTKVEPQDGSEEGPHPGGQRPSGLTVAGAGMKESGRELICHHFLCPFLCLNPQRPLLALPTEAVVSSGRVEKSPHEQEIKFFAKVRGGLRNWRHCVLEESLYPSPSPLTPFPFPSRFCSL